MGNLSDETPGEFAQRAVENTGLPMINAMGAQGSAQNELLNQAVRFQLEYVQQEVASYLPQERSWSDGKVDEQMPHEWGSLDSMDDMRNSMAVAVALMDEFLWVDPFKQQEFLRRVIADRGVCATDERVLELAWPGQVEDGTWMDELDNYLPEDERAGNPTEGG